MKNAFGIALLVTATLLPSSGVAKTWLDLAKEKQCLTCHDVDKKVRGPSFREIGDKYRKAPNFDRTLVARIISGTGSSGGHHWGTTTMPPSSGPRPAVSIEEATQLLDWILTLEHTTAPVK